MFVVGHQAANASPGNRAVANQLHFRCLLARTMSDALSIPRDGEQFGQILSGEDDL